MKPKSVYLLILIAMIFAACNEKNDLPAVKNFEVDKYLGKWYEIARLPNSFEKGLEHITANYEADAKGRLRVTNSGIQADGTQKSSDGRIKFADQSDVGLLKVSFFRPFYGQYKIIYLDDAYTTSVVTSKGYNYLWILHRNPVLEPATLNALKDSCANWGYDTSRLIFPEQEKLANE